MNLETCKKHIALLCLNVVFLLQRGYFCEMFGKPSDTLLESLKDLVLERVGGDFERLDAIVK